MNMLVEHNELVRRALAFILERIGPDAGEESGQGRNEKRQARFVALCDEAAMRFNLSPQDALTLSRALDHCSACSGQRDATGKSAPQDLNA